MEKAVVNGVRIAYRRVGSGRPLLLSGGTGMPPLTWEVSGFEVMLVAAGFEVISYAARGVAPSEAPPAPYSINEMAADAAGLIEHLELTDVTAVGYSLGSMTVELLAREHAQRLRSAVLLAGAGPTTTVLRATVAMEQELIAALGQIPPATATFQTLMTGLAPSVLASDDERVREWVDLLALQAEVWTSPEGEVGQAAAAEGWADDDARMARLRDIQIPILVVAFEHDPMFPPTTSRVAVDHLPLGEFAQVDGAGHAGLITHPAQTADAILHFLNRI